MLYHAKRGIDYARQYASGIATGRYYEGKSASRVLRDAGVAFAVVPIIGTGVGGAIIIGGVVHHCRRRFGKLRKLEIECENELQ